jgi:ABC-type polysaccharide/polyol phosphate export permease
VKLNLRHKRTMLFATPRIISALILREIGTSYGRSPGGYLWALAEPVLGIALLTVIFSIGFRTPPIGVNFPLFYATGLLPFLMFVDLSNKVAQAINYSKQLLAYPRVTFIDALLGRFILNFFNTVSCGIYHFSWCYIVLRHTGSTQLFTNCVRVGVDRRIVVWPWHIQLLHDVYVPDLAAHLRNLHATAFAAFWRHFRV